MKKDPEIISPKMTTGIVQVFITFYNYSLFIHLHWMIFCMKNGVKILCTFNNLHLYTFTCAIDKAGVSNILIHMLCIATLHLQCFCIRVTIT